MRVIPPAAIAVFLFPVIAPVVKPAAAATRAILATCSASWLFGEEEKGELVEPHFLDLEVVPIP